MKTTKETPAQKMVNAIVKSTALVDAVNFKGTRITKTSPVQVSAEVMKNERQAQHLELVK